MREREKHKQEQVEALKREMQSGMVCILLPLSFLHTTGEKYIM